MTDHARAQELAAAAIDFELANDERGELDKHLSTCATCRDHADALRLDARTLGDLRQVNAPDRVRRRVVAGPRRAWGMPLALAAAVGVLVLAVGLVVSSGLNRPGRDVAVNPTPGSPAASIPAATGATPPSSSASAAAPTPGPKLPTTAWVAVDDPVAFSPKATTPKKDTSVPPPCGIDCGDTAGPSVSRRSVIRAAIQTTGGIVAVGHGCIGNQWTTCQADVWLSPDARRWGAVPNDGSLYAGADNYVSRPAGMMDVATGHGSIVAVGSVTKAHRSVPMAWVSADGRAWRPIGLAHDGDGQAFAVASGPSTLVAVGRVRTIAGVVAAAWLSSDGTAWEAVTDIDGAAVGHFKGDEWHVGGMLDVTWADHQFVAVGAYCTNVDTCRTASWTSIDGRAWTRAPGRGTTGRMASVAYAESGLVAVGTDGSGGPIRGRAWFSSDGSSWTNAQIDASGVDAESPLYTVVAVGSGAIAAGEQYALQSSDGRSWTRAADRALAEGSVFGLAALADGVIATGAMRPAPADDENESPPAIWVLPYR